MPGEITSPYSDTRHKKLPAIFNHSHGFEASCVSIVTLRRHRNQEVTDE